MTQDEQRLFNERAERLEEYRVRISALEAELAAERTRLDNTRTMLWEILDSLGALSNPSELSGWGIDKEKAKQMIDAAMKGAK